MALSGKDYDWCTAIRTVLQSLAMNTDREFDSHAAAALLGNDLGQVVHTNVPLFTKQ